MTPFTARPESIEGIPDGIHLGLTFSEYRRIDAWNWSLIKLLDPERGSPLHVRYTQDHPDAGNTASRGALRGVHCAVLEPENYDLDFAVFDGVRNIRHAKYQAFIAEHRGATVLNPRENADIIATADAVRAHPAAAALMAAGRGEVTVVWHDDATGLRCKARIDWLAPGWFFDLKTLGTTGARRVSRMCAQHGYHGQIAHYAAGLAAHGIDIPAYLVVAEGTGAQDVAVYAMDAGAPDGPLHVGAVRRAEYMARLAECVATDEWPGRHPEPVELMLPSYALLDHDDEITFGDQQEG